MRGAKGCKHSLFFDARVSFCAGRRWAGHRSLSLSHTHTHYAPHHPPHGHQEWARWRPGRLPHPCTNPEAEHRRRAMGRPRPPGRAGDRSGWYVYSDELLGYVLVCLGAPARVSSKNGARGVFSSALRASQPHLPNHACKSQPGPPSSPPPSSPTWPPPPSPRSRNRSACRPRTTSCSTAPRWARTTTSPSPGSSRARF